MLALFPRQIEPQLVRGEGQGILGGPPKIGVPTRQRAEPLVLELPGSPGIAQLGSMAGKELLYQRRDRAKVEDRKGVEREGLDPWRDRGLRDAATKKRGGRHASGRQSQEFPSP
jgi:hypothetical protein